LNIKIGDPARHARKVVLQRSIALALLGLWATESFCAPAHGRETLVADALLARSTLDPLVRKLAYWVKLDEADRAALHDLPHSVKTLPQNGYIVREGDRATHSCLLLSGFAMRQKIVAEGHRQIVSIHMKGEMVDLQNSLLGYADHGVQMLTAGKVAMIPREEIVRIAYERPAIGRAMWTDTLVDASIFREWVANVGRRDATTRVAHLL